MPEYNVHIVIDSDHLYQADQVEALKKAITEKVDLLTGAGAASISVIVVGPGHRNRDIDVAWHTLRRHLPGRYAELEKAMNHALSVAGVRELLQLANTLESEIRSAERRGARNALTRGRF